MQRVWSTYLDESQKANERAKALPFPSNVRKQCSKLFPTITTRSLSFADLQFPDGQHIVSGLFSTSRSTDTLSFLLPLLLSSLSDRFPRRSSLHSQAPSTRPIMQPDSLNPPSAPFASSSRPTSSITLNQLDSRKGGDSDAASISLSVNYLPSKFSSGLLSPGPRKRKNAANENRMPKRGGGIDAFRSGEARVAGAGDEDYDGISTGWLGGSSRAGRRMRWTRFKWILLFANTLVRALH